MANGRRVRTASALLVALSVAGLVLIAAAPARSQVPPIGLPPPPATLPPVSAPPPLAPVFNVVSPAGSFACSAYG